MRYVVLVGGDFDENQMKKALDVGMSLGAGVDYITFAGWNTRAKDYQPEVWRKQEAWLKQNGVPKENIVTPFHMAWPGSVGVNRYGRAVSVFDQLECVSHLTTDDFWSKGELFFVGPSEIENLVMEIACFMQIPRDAEKERCEYHVSDSTSLVSSDLVVKSLEFLNQFNTVTVWNRFQSAEKRRRKAHTWLAENCA